MCSPRISRLAVAGPLAAALLATTATTATAQRLDREGLVALTDLEDGALRAEVLLPCGQAYVEAFQRHEGLQNVARDVTASEREVGGGVCVYSAVTGGFGPGDAVETRFYSYLPAQPGVFTPGPIEGAWIDSEYGASPAATYDGDTFVTADATWSLDPACGRDVEVYLGRGTSHIVPMATGWSLSRAAVPPLTVPVGNYDTARLASVYVRECPTGVWVPLVDAPAFDYHHVTELVSEGIYQLTPTTYSTLLPGTRVDPRFECGGYPITIQTRIGPQTLVTAAQVDYAFVVVHHDVAR